MPKPITAKDLLTGVTLATGWRVTAKIPQTASDSGGNFSAGYLVESPAGEKYFLKAIDFSLALSAPDPARALQVLTEAFNLERDILDIGKRLSHVVTMVSDGTTIVTGPRGADTVQYLILELADSNLRRMAVKSRRLPMSLALRALHNVTNGLRQLHGRQVAHQDMKPSNVLSFPGETFKVCDVGRASIKGRNAPHDGLAVAGDQTYAPPELLFGQINPEFTARRWGCDAYLLGSLAAFLICGTPMTALLISELHVSARPGTWGGSYAAVLPQVQAAYARALDRLRTEIAVDAPYRDEMLLCISQLCDPDPNHRGHPMTHATQTASGNVYDLERYVSIFDRLTKLAGIYERRIAGP